MTLTTWAAWALTSVVVALAGPFGTFSTQPFQWRLLYWGALIALSIIIAVTLRTIWRDTLKNYPYWVEDIAVVTSLALVFGPIVVTMNRYIGGESAREAMSLGVAMLIVFSIAACTISVRHALEKDPVASPAKAPKDRLLTRIPEVAEGRLARISSDNHHIRVMLQDGQEHRLLLRLRDAVQEVDQEQGMCVHRSHWVATAAIKTVNRDGPREFVELTCGGQVPVGPKYRSNLIEAGVISE